MLGCLDILKDFIENLLRPFKVKTFRSAILLELFDIEELQEAVKATKDCSIQRDLRMFLRLSEVAEHYEPRQTSVLNKLNIDDINDMINRYLVD